MRNFRKPPKTIISIILDSPSTLGPTVVIFKNFTDPISEILIFRRLFFRILKKFTFSRFFGTPGGLYWLPYANQHPPRRDFRFFSRFLKVFRLEKAPKDARGPMSTRNFTGNSFLMVSERFRTDLILKSWEKNIKKPRKVDFLQIPQIPTLLQPGGRL